MAAYERRRNLVQRPDGRLVNVARPRGQLFVCYDNCCCGRPELGLPPVPVDVYQEEWERRRLRNFVHLTIGGCLGPCALANVALLLFDGQALWFHSLNDAERVRALYDYAEDMLDAGSALPAPPALAPYQFTASAWQPRPDGAPVDDLRRRAAARADPTPFDATEGYSCEVPDDSPEAIVARLVAQMQGADGLPRKNGELVFDAPWQARAFGLAVALHEQGLYDWEEFRQELIGQIGIMERGEGAFEYYAAWLAAFEALLARKGLVTDDTVEERAFQFEFGERDDVL